MLNIKNKWFILADESFNFKNIPVEYFNVKTLVFIDQNYKMSDVYFISIINKLKII